MYIFSFALFIHWLAQAVSTQLSPISKLDVFRFATCMSSQQNRKTYIFSWRQAGDMPHACQAYQTSRPGKVCKPSKPSRQARQGRQGRQGRQARQGTSSGNAAIANFKIGRLSVCDMYIFSTGSQHVYPFFGHTNTLAATIGGNAATANFKIGRLSICDVYLLHRIAKCISFLLPYSYIGWHKQCQRSYLQFQNWTSFGLRPVCLLNRIAKRISFLGPHQPYGPRLLGSR